MQFKYIFIMKKLLFILMIAMLGMTACGPSPEKLVEQGKKYLENDNCVEAANCFAKAADKGNTDAMCYIGNMFYFGYCYEEDKEKAAECYKIAAEKDCPEAQNMLAAMYYYGVGVPQDFEKSAKWAKKAAAYDMADAQYVLANLYIDGRGVPQDFNKAAELLLKVEKKGGDLVKEAQSVLAFLYLEGWGVPQSDDKAVEMLRKASGLSLAETQLKIGELYNKGNKDLHIKRDADKTVKWFRRAAENGNATAQLYMGNVYQKGIGVTKSLTDAKYWWQKAADQGNDDAKEALRSVAKAEKKARETNQTFTVNGVSFEMIYVKGGTFTMGGTTEQFGGTYDREKPEHSVTLSDYHIGKYEVTQKLWMAVMGNNPSHFKGDNLPVESVSWNDAQEFIKKLNRLTGQKFRLPTEAEWEYAARGGNKSRGYKYSGGNSIGLVAWYDENSENRTHIVGSNWVSNELGICDMSGNVWEWCQDWYGDYSSGSQTNPMGPSSGTARVLRGGSWSTRAAEDCRVSYRNLSAHDNRFNCYGFRLVLVP